MYSDRVALYKQLEEVFDSKILAYITSDRPNMSAQIAPDVIDYFIDHLDKIGPCNKISLVLYTRGGDTSAARNIVNLLRMYCDILQVIVPHKAHSSGTIISLGANEVVMTKQATLGPIDPSLHTALNPQVPDRSYVTSAISTDTQRYVIVDPDEMPNINMEETGKYSVFDIANWFLLKGEMTQKKLQKLCYYAQAWCYALKGYRLEDTDYQAWVHGPVSPALWERFKSFGYDPIRIGGSVKVKLDAADEDLLEDVWDTYGDNTGNALEALTHRELPWMEARRGYEPDERCTVVISPITMASYYKSIYVGD